MLEVIPAILTDDPKELEHKIRQVARLRESYGEVKRVQIDIVDGIFANNRTVGVEAVAAVETDLLLDVQLMVKEPIDWVDRAIEAMIDRVIGHIEMMSSQGKFVGKVTEVGHQVGLALDIDTPVSALDVTILNNLNVVLVMSVKAGFGGQEFDQRALEKVRQLGEIRVRDDTPFRICVDGGIDTGNIAEVRRAGADEAVAGHALFTGDFRGNLEDLLRGANLKIC